MLLPLLHNFRKVIVSRIAFAGVLNVSLLSLLMACAPRLWAQVKPFAPEKMETILYGVAFYPEYMPYERLDRDVELMQKAGITVVRVGESTWSSWEAERSPTSFAT